MLYYMDPTIFIMTHSEAVATLVDADAQSLRSPKVLVNAAKTGILSARSHDLHVIV